VWLPVGSVGGVVACVCDHTKFTQSVPLNPPKTHPFAQHPPPFALAPQLYGLYKRSTAGACNVRVPTILVEPIARERSVAVFVYMYVWIYMYMYTWVCVFGMVCVCLYVCVRALCAVLCPTKILVEPITRERCVVCLYVYVYIYIFI
jgi:hypothetical protein